MHQVQTLIGVTMIAAHDSTLPEIGEPRALWLQRLGPRIRWPEGQVLLDARLARLWTRRNGSPCFEHELTFSNGSDVRRLRIQGASSCGERSKAQRTHAHFRNGSLSGIRIFDQTTDCLWCTADRDRALDSRELFDREFLKIWLRERLQGVLPRECSVDFDQLNVRVIAHRMGKRCVMRVRTAGARNPGLFLKVHAHAPPTGQLSRLVELTSLLELATGGRFRVPQLLFYDHERHVSICREMPFEVRSIDDTLASDGEIAVVLAALHALPGRIGKRIHSKMDELNTVLRWRTLFTRLSPDLPLELFHNLVEQLSRRMPEIVPGEPCMIHRDLHAGQIGTGQGQIWILDWDTCCMGSPELDIATFMAHRMTSDLISGPAFTGVSKRLPAFLAAYTRAGGRYGAQTLRWHLGVALTRLGALQSGRGLDASHIQAMWSLAGEILRGDCWSSGLDRM